MIAFRGRARAATSSHRCVASQLNYCRPGLCRPIAKAQSELFLPLSTDVQTAAREVLAGHPRLVGIGSGHSGADPFVIALARARGGVVVTEETLSGNLNRPRIPDVCDTMGVTRLNLIGFVQQGWRF
jgi:hypothetical protein